MDLARLMVVFLFQGLGSIFLLILSIKYIKKRGIARENVFFIIFCLFFIIAAFMNMIYVFIFEEFTVKVLYAIAMLGLVSAPIALVFLSLNFLTSKIELKVQYLVLGIITIINFIVLLVLGTSHLTVNDSTNWTPEWDILYFNWFMNTFIIIVIVNVIFMLRVYIKLANPSSKRT